MINKALSAGIFLLLISCSASRNYSPARKYSPEELKEDLRLARNILESKHPSLYWYTSKDSMDAYFNAAEASINDSLTEQLFAWHILAPVVDKINCGHTTVGMSKAYANWARGKQLPSFPLFMKVWNDTMAVTGSLIKNDSIFKRGTLITGINGKSNQELVNTIFSYLPQDGYANNINYIRMSGNFPYYHRNIYGISKEYLVDYIDSAGRPSRVNIKPFQPVRDTTEPRKKPAPRVKRKRPSREQRFTRYRNMETDLQTKTAFMTVNSFTKGHMRTFFRRSFREMREGNMENLVIDIRSNGGGRVGLSTLLTKYISSEPFRVADSLYAKSRSLAPYSRYFKGKWINNIGMFFYSSRQEDGMYHIRHLERKVYKPKKNRFRGNVYVLTNGPTFSAATLFANAVKGQPHVTLIGEETGGGWHGNNGIIIPDVTLPNTRTRIRVPLYRLVQYQHVPKSGTGIIPDIYVGTSYEALLKGYDKKMQVVREIIKQRK